MICKNVLRCVIRIKGCWKVAMWKWIFGHITKMSTNVENWPFKLTGSNPRSMKLTWSRWTTVCIPLLWIHAWIYWGNLFTESSTRKALVPINLPKREYLNNMQKRGLHDKQFKNHKLLLFREYWFTIEQHTTLSPYYTFVCWLMPIHWAEFSILRLSCLAKEGELLSIY